MAGLDGILGVGNDPVFVRQMDDLLNLDPSSLAAIVVRTVVVYSVLLVGLRLAGKRELGQMTPFDLLVILLISNAVQNAMVGSDVSLSGGVMAAVTLLAVNWLVAAVTWRIPWLERALAGSPTLLVHQGVLLKDHLQREGIAEKEVMQALREHGVDDLRTVKLAVLEVDETISVIPSNVESTRTRRRLRGRQTLG